MLWPTCYLMLLQLQSCYFLTSYADTSSVLPVSNAWQKVMPLCMPRQDTGYHSFCFPFLYSYRLKTLLTKHTCNMKSNSPLHEIGRYSQSQALWLLPISFQYSLRLIIDDILSNTSSCVKRSIPVNFSKTVSPSSF